MAKTLVTDTDISLSSLHQQLLIKPAASNDSTTVVQIQNSAGTVVLNVDTTNNRVGIGTASPGALLHVSKDQNTQTDIRFDNPNAGTAASALFDMRNGALGDNDRLLFGVTGTGYTAVTGWGDAGVLTTQANISGGLILNANAGEIKFETGANGSANQRMVITNSGNVGIGTTAPGYKLEVLGSSNTEIARVGDGTRSFGISTYTPNSGGVTLRNSGTGLISLTAANAVLIGTSYAGLGTGVSANTVAIEGNVGIGISSPTAKLHVAGGKILLDNTQGIQIKDATGTARTVLQVDGGDNLYLDSTAAGGDIYLRASGVDKLTIKATSGNVGIGTATPGNKLAIVGSGAVIRITGTNDTSAAYFQFNSSASTGLGYAGVEGSTPGATLTGTLAYATFLSAGSSGSALQLGTPGGIRATILASGNVGIGTTAPTSKLEVLGLSSDPTATIAGLVSIRSSDAQAANKGGSIALGGYRNDAATEVRTFGGINGYKENGTTGNAAGYLAFSTNNNGALVEAVRVTSTGNVGIGTTAPGVKLDVLGSARVYNSTADAAILIGSDQVDANSGKISYNRGTANLDITPRSTYATNLVGKLKFSITNSTGANSVSLGANSPATILTAPYTWITVITSDGTTGFMPIWK